MNNVTLIQAQSLYVIANGEGASCLGFANARDHVNHIADKLGRIDLAFADEDYGSLAGYQKYLRAIEA